MAVYIFITIKMIVLLVYQFEYDFCTTRLSLKRASLNVSETPQDGGHSICQQFGHNDTDCLLEQDYERRIASSYAFMKKLGNPYINCHWTV